MNPGPEDYPTPNCMYCKTPTLEPWEYKTESGVACPRCSRATVEGIEYEIRKGIIKHRKTKVDDLKEISTDIARAVLAYLGGKEG